MVARVAGRVGEFRDGDVGRGDVGVAETEVDHVGAPVTGLDLESVDDREHVGRQVRDATELHDR